MIEVARQAYPDRDTLMRDLAELVADQLRAAHAGKGHATLAVPGGTTPGPFLAALSEADLAWKDIRVLPTDERMVSELSPRSNARLIRETLLTGRAAEAEFVDVYEPLLGARPKRVAAVLPIDVAVLGMGADMHTASLFPGAPELAAALAEDAPELVEITPPGQPEARLTLPARVLRAAGVIHILITGADKLAALERALEEGPVEAAPVRAVLTAPAPVTVHYAE
ncbi:6-phosphogluconolactonase [Amaricoccus sp.]|mgnify:CR=1 FL=1|uniref:6-phosphogluconolactonase n=1 Tax=Amaricoccus sp. TaxID=1872485 RepID=UPI00263A19DC|nr:6-phosphogluconolactonase [Amaricoccus sp.]HRO13049.1 6-phosphogluconolactonase [Amaricoccus sp.]